MMGKSIDVMICPKGIYEEYHSQQFFLNIEEVLGDSVEQYSGLVLEDALLLKTTDEMRDKLGVTDDEVYVGVTVNGRHTENAKELVKCLLESFSF